MQLIHRATPDVRTLEPVWRTGPMFTQIRKIIVFSWNFVFDHEVSPLRHIKDVAIRHYILQALGLMWATSFAIATASYSYLAASLVGHAVLIAAAAITVATWTIASTNPHFFQPAAAIRRRDRNESQPEK